MPTVAKKATARSANPTEAVSHLADVTDRMHGLLMDRADALMAAWKVRPKKRNWRRSRISSRPMNANTGLTAKFRAVRDSVRLKLRTTRLTPEGVPLRTLLLRFRAFFELRSVAPHELVLFLHRANRCNVLYRIKRSDEVLCQTGPTKRECVARPCAGFT